MRLDKIVGEMNGINFEVKPSTVQAVLIDAELKEELAAWSEKHNKEYNEFVRKNAEAITAGDINVLTGDFPEYKEWILDEDFRAARFKKMAMACMKFEKPVPEELWKSVEIEYSQIEVAFDFFTKKRVTNM